MPRKPTPQRVLHDAAHEWFGGNAPPEAGLDDFLLEKLAGEDYEIVEVGETETLQAEITQLRESLEPGKASAIVAAMFDNAARLGHPRTSAIHGLTYLVELAEAGKAQADLFRSVASQLGQDSFSSQAPINYIFGLARLGHNIIHHDTPVEQLSLEALGGTVVPGGLESLLAPRTAEDAAEEAAERELAGTGWISEAIASVAPAETVEEKARRYDEIMAAAKQSGTKSMLEARQQHDTPD